jgi:glycosyltransferase involved in cell wall biosynthesis
LDTRALRVVSGTLFFPRGGSAFVARALARGLSDRGAAVTLVAGSRHDLGGTVGDARSFYAGLDLYEVDFTPALSAPDPMTYSGPPGTAPLHPSFEDRPGAPDRVFASLDDATYRLHVDAWARALTAAGAADADVLHLHHLTPLDAAAELVAPGVPVVAQVHGTELLMLQAIAGGAGWAYAAEWADRIRAWAANSAEVIVAPGNEDRASRLLELPRERLSTLPNGFDEQLFRPLEVDRQAVWRRVLVDEPRGWAPGQAPGSIRYDGDALARVGRGPVIAYVGRYTEVKRLPLLLAAFADARARLSGPASLVLVGGHPGEWEGEHPAAAIERLGIADVFLAGWYQHDELPELLAASDLLVLPSAEESFGQVIVEAMACGVPAIAANALGPARIIDDRGVGWLFAPDDRRSLADALVQAVGDAPERATRGRRALAEAPARFCWGALAARLEELLQRAAATRA